MNNKPIGFDGLAVAVLGDSDSAALAIAISEFHGIPKRFSFDTSDASRSGAIADFSNRLLTAEIDLVVFATGVGVNYVTDQASRTVERKRFLDCLSDTTTIAGSPHAAQAMLAIGVEPTLAIEPSNSWRNLMMAIDQFASVANQLVGLEETGPFRQLAANLEARGASVAPIPVFPQVMPSDVQLAAEFFERINRGEFHAVLITSPEQAIQFCFLANSLSRTPYTDRILDNHLVLTIGAGTNEILQNHGIDVDFSTGTSDPHRAIAEMADKVCQLRKQKSIIRVHLSGPGSSSSDPNAPWFDSPFMRACRCEPTDVTPVWLTEQNQFFGKTHFPENVNDSFRHFYNHPDRCAEATCEAVNRLGVDAGIVHLDPIAMLASMGCALTFSSDGISSLEHPIRSASDIEQLLSRDTEPLFSMAMETVKQARNDLPADIPLIGFSVSPLTLATSLIDGTDSRDIRHTKALLFSDPGNWNRLMHFLANVVANYLNVQIDAGAQVVQLLDSAAGCLSYEDYRKLVYPHAKNIIASLPSDVPVIHSASGNPALLPLLAETQAAVIGIDEKSRLDIAWKTIGHDRAVQGNLDPAILLTRPAEICHYARALLDLADGKAGHLLSPGSAILSGTPIDHVVTLIDFVHESSKPA